MFEGISEQIQNYENSSEVSRMTTLTGDTMRISTSWITVDYGGIRWNTVEYGEYGGIREIHFFLSMEYLAKLEELTAVVTLDIGQWMFHCSARNMEF